MELCTLVDTVGSRTDSWKVLIAGGLKFDKWKLPILTMGGHHRLSQARAPFYP